jgi:hypothetical protein
LIWQSKKADAILARVYPHWHFHLLFAYTSLHGTRSGRLQQRTRLAEDGPFMLIATCLILAVRTAEWPAQWNETASNTDLDSEIEYAHRLASRVFSTLIAKHSALLPSKQKPWYQRMRSFLDRARIQLWPELADSEKARVASLMLLDSWKQALLRRGSHPTSKRSSGNHSLSLMTRELHWTRQSTSRIGYSGKCLNPSRWNILVR